MSADRTSWKELVPGILVSAAMIALVLAVLLFVRIGTLRGSKATIYAAAAEARGLLSGSEVWLAGQRVGNVKGIRFLPPTPDTTRRLVIEMEVLREHLPLIRRDSYAQIRAGGSFIGAPVLYLTIGTPVAQPLTPGDTMRTEPQGDPETVASSIASASKAFPEIARNVRRLNTQFGEILGSPGVTGTQAGLTEFVSRTAEMARILARAQSGTGTTALALADTSFHLRIASLLAGTDSIRALLASPETSLGRFRRDSTLVRSMQAVRAELGVVRGLLDEPAGTAGRVLHDDAIAMQLKRAEAELDAIIADVRRNPFRYLVF